MKTGDPGSFMRVPIDEREVRSILRSLDSERIADEGRGHFPGAPEVGEFAILWWMKGVRTAVTEFTEIARHLRLDRLTRDPGPRLGPQIVKSTCAECAEVLADIFAMSQRDGVQAHVDWGRVSERLDQIGRAHV